MCVLLQEVRNMHEATTDSDQQVITLFNLDVNLALSKLIDTFGFPQEQDVQFTLLRELIDIIS